MYGDKKAMTEVIRNSILVRANDVAINKIHHKLLNNIQDSVNNLHRKLVQENQARAQRTMQPSTAHRNARQPSSSDSESTDSDSDSSSDTEADDDNDQGMSASEKSQETLVNG